MDDNQPQSAAYAHENDLLQPIGQSRMVGDEKPLFDEGVYKAGVSGFSTNNRKSLRYLHHDENDNPIGALQIMTDGPRSKKAVIQNVYVAEPFRRSKIATGLLKRARQDYDVRHSDDLTNAGRFFAKAVKKDGGEVNDYRGQHEAPGPDSGAPMHDLTGVYPDDVYSGKGFSYYGETGLPYDRENFGMVQSAKARPHMRVPIYRAVPKDKTIKDINPGDWVATHPQYAKDHGDSVFDGNYKILKKIVKARDLFTAGDSHHEWGYHPQPVTSYKQRIAETNESRAKFGMPPIEGKANGGALDDKDEDGITAYHGSPHDFEQFDTSKIGTGEGAQAYGHGLYFAQSEPVAKEYRDNLIGRGTIISGAADALPDRWQMAVYEALKKPSGEIRDVAINKLRSIAPPEVAKKINELLNNKGHMYEVHIKAHPDHFLDWDKPVSEQSEHVQKALRPHHSIMSQAAMDMFDGKPEDLSGRDLYQWLSGEHEGGLGSPKHVTEQLSNLGIKGIKYLDAGSRGQTDKPTRNYVVFDHNHVSVKRKYEQGGRVGYAVGGTPMTPDELAKKNLEVQQGIAPPVEGGHMLSGTGNEPGATPISSSTSYGPSSTANANEGKSGQNTSWAGNLNGAFDAFGQPSVDSMSFAEGKSASMGPYGDLSGIGSFSNNNDSNDADNGDDSGDDGGDAGGDGGEGGGGGGDGGGGGGGDENRGGRIYPKRHHIDWEKKKGGGSIVNRALMVISKKV